MIVCICRSVNDRQIRETIENGASSFDEIQMELPVGIHCGQCKQTVCGLLTKSRKNETGSISSVFPL